MQKTAAPGRRRGVPLRARRAYLPIPRERRRGAPREALWGSFAAYACRMYVCVRGAWRWGRLRKMICLGFGGGGGGLWMVVVVWCGCDRDE